MRFLSGFIAAFLLVALGAYVAIITGAYNVAATVPDTEAERVILDSAMTHSVRAHVGTESPQSWSDEQIKNGFKQYGEMCIICHGAPGKERTDISKGLHPQPPNLAEAVIAWSNAELFWIIKNGIRMTGMPAFGPTHQDGEIWGIVGFLRRLPRISAQDFQEMEKQLGGSPGEDHQHD
jgi:mono/diheme cytochrome c family protein